MNIQFTQEYSPAQADAMAAELQRLGVGSVRVGVSWNEVAARGRSAELGWASVDPTVARLARHGIRALPFIFGTPTWAVPLLYRLNSDAKYYAPERAEDFGVFAGQLARRYGPGGTFWTAHPELDGSAAITAVELWNEPNLKWAFKPRVDAPKYGQMYRSARAAIKGQNPSVTAVVGGLDPSATPDRGQPMTDFLNAMGSSGVEAIAVHPYGPSADVVLGYIGRLRGWMHPRGLAAAPIYVTEWGYPDERFAANGSRGLGETARGGLFRDVTSSLSRSDCHVAEVHPHTWDSDETLVSSDPFTQSWQRYQGLANPLPAPAVGFDVYGEAEELGRTARELLGREGQPARATVHACGLPAPDRDADGVPDQHDYAPLDAFVTSSPTSAPPSSFDRPSLAKGSFVAGRTVATTLGTWDGSPRPALGVVRWEHCASAGDDCQSFPDSASVSLLLPELAAGRRVRTIVRAVNEHGEATATTELSDVVGIAPKFLSQPTLLGTFKLGKTVWIDPGSWFAVPGVDYVGYQWYHCATPGSDCRPIGGAGAQRTLTLEAGHVNRYIKAVMILRNIWGTNTATAYGPKVALL